VISLTGWPPSLAQLLNRSRLLKSSRRPLQLASAPRERNHEDPKDGQDAAECENNYPVILANFKSSQDNAEYTADNTDNGRDPSSGSPSPEEPVSFSSPSWPPSAEPFFIHVRGTPTHDPFALARQICSQPLGIAGEAGAAGAAT
jgi:hypothetical protein